MNFFTRELLEFADSTDPGTTQWAHDEWERVSGEYLKHLRQLEPQFPRSVRELAKLNLHDARVIRWGMNKQERRLFILLHTEGGEDVLLHYHISKPFEFNCTQPPPWQEPFEWLYDELDTETRDGATTFRHSILLNNGAELRVYFHEVDIEEYASPQSVGQAIPAEAACRI